MSDGMKPVRKKKGKKNGSDDDVKSNVVLNSFVFDTSEKSTILLDKYNVASRQDIKFHRKLYSSLLNWVSEDITDINTKDETRIIEESTPDTFPIIYKQYEDSKSDDKYNKFKKLPNILINGGKGSGKKTLIKMLLQEIFGSGIAELEEEDYVISGYGNSDVDIKIMQSPYHMIIEPTNSGFDKYVIQEVAKEYAKLKVLQVFSAKIPYKIILINNVDNLSYYAQTSLRCTMSMYQKNCRFILCSYQSSKIIDPIRSRCLNIRVPRPTELELFDYLMEISIDEGITITAETIKYIIRASQRDIKQCLWKLNYYKNKIYTFDTSWKKYLKTITEFIRCIYTDKNNPNITALQMIRNIINNILITNITGTEIMMELLQQIIVTNTMFPNKLMMAIIELFSKYEIKLSKGKRSIIHIEALIMNICAIAFVHPKIKKLK
jgi:replication factor C subunit 3/5